MGIWIRRVFMLYSMSLGLAFAFFPFNHSRSGETSTPRMLLKTVNVVGQVTLSELQADPRILEFKYEELEEYPSLREAVMRMGGDWTEWEVDREDWRRFVKDHLPAGQESALLQFREALFHLEGTEVSGLEGGAESVPARITYLGYYSPAFPEISLENLDQYPAVASALEGISGETVDFEEVYIPMNEWESFTDRFLAEVPYSRVFFFGGNAYTNEYTTEYVTYSGEIENLQTYLQIAGGLLILAGLLLLRRLYFRKQGIMVNPPWVAALWDFITFAFLLVAAYPAADTILVKLLHLAPAITDDYSVFMGNFCFYFTPVFVSLYTTRMTSQSLLVDSLGVEVDGLMGRQRIAWADLESFELSSEYVAVSRVGVPIPRKLQKVLEIKGKQGQSISVNEPQLKSVKGRIKSVLTQNAPEEIKAQLRTQLDRW